jgi:lysophospholipase L1-like esterase
MKPLKWLTCFLLALLLAAPAWALAESETLIALGDGITQWTEPPRLPTRRGRLRIRQSRNHEDVGEALAGVENTVVTITAAGTYRITGSLSDGQIVVAAPEDAGCA